jgi:ABC-2 type transport system ATP-binding protein
MSRAAASARADELIAALDLRTVADRKVSTLSGGQRRRLDIAMGLVHRPHVLFLDEPSTGLDPQNRANLQTQIERLHEETGNTIVLTTHYLEEADALAERVIVIDHGQVIADDTAYRLKSGLGDRITFGFADETGATVAADRTGRIPGAHVSRLGREVVARVVDGNESVSGLVHDLHEAGHAPTSIEVVRPTLDDVFLELTGRSLREANESTAPENEHDNETEEAEVAA